MTSEALKKSRLTEENMKRKTRKYQNVQDSRKSSFVTVKTAATATIRPSASGAIRFMLIRRAI
jgi:hypothetical protein